MSNEQQNQLTEEQLAQELVEQLKKERDKQDYQDGNLEVWNKVRTPLTGATKRVTGAGRQAFTSIDPMYLTEKATQIFGMYGLDWGLSESTFDFESMREADLVIHHATFFFYRDGRRGEFPISNSMKTHMGRDAKRRIDEDFVKKVETNTIGKALSRLGFGADIYMGRFDDAAYVNTLRINEQMETQEKNEEAQEKAYTEFKEWIAKEIKALELIAHPASINQAALAIKRKIPRLCAQFNGATDKWNKAVENKAAELIEKAQQAKGE